MSSAHEFLPQIDSQIAKIGDQSYQYSTALTAWEKSVLLGAEFTTIAPISFDDSTSVILTGIGFTGATDVQFNGISAVSFTVDLDTQITAIPAAVGGVTDTQIQIVLSSGAIIVNPEIVQQTIGSDPDITAVINAINATTGTLTIAQETAISNRIAALKNNGFWADIRAYYGFAGGTDAAHAINWKNPGTHDITWVGSGFTHAANGVTSDGSAGTYGDVGFAPDAQPSTLTIGAYIGAYPAVLATKYLIGAEDGSKDSALLITSFNSLPRFQGKILQSNAANADPGVVGVALATRTGINAQAIYHDGLTGTQASTEQAPGSDNYYLFANNNDGAAQQYGDARIQSFIFIDAGVTFADYQSFETAEDAYQSAMGR